MFKKNNHSPIFNRRIHVTFFLALIICGLLFATIFIKNAEAADQPNTDFGYARIYTAKVTDGINMSLDELEVIARENGTEEVLMFPLSEGPEEGVERWVVRLGPEAYAFPGLTLKARTHLAEQERTDVLKLSKDRKKATEQLPTEDATLEWSLPETIAVPLECVIIQHGKLLAINTIHEKLSPSGKQRWPKVIRISSAKKWKHNPGF